MMRVQIAHELGRGGVDLLFALLLIKKSGGADRKRDERIRRSVPVQMEFGMGARRHVLEGDPLCRRFFFAPCGAAFEYQFAFR